MRKIIGVVLILVVWGLLAWGNLALIDYINASYARRMDANYLVDRYSGRVLLTQSQYTELKEYLLNTDVKIRNLDVYSSDEVLVIYDITSPDTYKSSLLGEPQSQSWYYDRGRGMDYAAFGCIVFLSFIVGSFLTSFTISTFMKR